MDVCLQIIDKPASHSLPSEKDIRRFRRGDIISVYLATDIGTFDGSDYIPNEPVSSPRCGFVFVTNVPDNAWDKIQNIISSETDVSGNLLYKRKFRAQVLDIPLAIRTQFIADRYITFTWTQVKNYIKRTNTATLITDLDIS